MLSALLLFLHNRAEDRRSGEIAGEKLTQLQAIIELRAAEQEAEREPTVLPDPGQQAPNGQADPSDDPRWENPEDWPDTDFDPTEIPSAAESDLPTVTLSEIQYVGVISLPALGIELPVMGPGNYDRLNIGPICQFGSPVTGDMVIAAHNTNNFFGRIDSLRPGDAVTFTDVNGKVYRYAVDHGELLQVGQVSEARNNGYPLGLYTCAYDGTLRFIVLCTRA